MDNTGQLMVSLDNYDTSVALGRPLPPREAVSILASKLHSQVVSSQTLLELDDPVGLQDKLSKCWLGKVHDWHVAKVQPNINNKN